MGSNSNLQIQQLGIFHHGLATYDCGEKKLVGKRSILIVEKFRRSRSPICNMFLTSRDDWPNKCRYPWFYIDLLPRVMWWASSNDHPRIQGRKTFFLRKSRSLSRKPVTPEYVTAVVSLALPRVLSKNDSRRRLFVAAEVITSKIVSLTIRAVRSVLGKMEMTVNVCSAKPKDGKIMFPVPGGPKKVPIFAALGIGRRDTRHTSKVSLERPYLSDSSVLKIFSSIAHNKFLLIIFVWWTWTEIKTNKCFLTNLLLLA